MAASAGTVAVGRCNAIAPDGSDYDCDRDGFTAVRDCGWYVDIGQIIGLSETSGTSSGPHRHFASNAYVPER